MKNMQEIQKSIDRIITKEKVITEKEIEEFEHKIKDNEEVYGFGGRYKHFIKALERRQQHLDDLEALQNAQGGAVVLVPMKLYPWYCPSCQETIYTTDDREKNYVEHTIDCPHCTRPIYKSANYTTWQVQSGSKYSDTRLRG